MLGSGAGGLQCAPPRLVVLVGDDADHVVGNLDPPDGESVGCPIAGSPSPLPEWPSEVNLTRTMHVLSVNVGLPRRVQWRDRTIETGIFKEPVAGRVAVEPLNLRGDRQADLSVHGGASKAVYAYPHEHYAFWKRELELQELPPGSFGENLTVLGFAESEVRIGERWRVGSCELAVTEPRMPCFKLAARFQRPDMIRRFLASRRTGFYFRVLQPGDLGAGDTVELLERNEFVVSVADVVELFATKAGDRDLARRALATESLPEGWRDWIAERIESGLP